MHNKNRAAEKLPSAFERVIYVIPFTSIIEQNAQVFRDRLSADVMLQSKLKLDGERDRE